MKCLKCILEFNNTWILSRRDDDILPVERISTEIKNAFDVPKIKKSISDCEFVLSVDEKTSEDSLNEEITRTIFLLYGDEINKTDFHVSIVPIDNEVETQTKDSDKNEPSDENESERMSDPKAHNKKQKEVSEVKKKAAFDEIDNLIGAEEFKALANECVIIAPYLKDSRAEDTFLERKYLISVNEGYGLSCYLKLFGSLTEELGLYNLHPSSPVDEIILPTPDSSKDFNELFAPALSSISSKLKKQIICIDISEWMSKIADKSFRAFLKRIDQGGKNKIVFFRVPILEPDVLMRIKKDLSDYLFIKSFSIAPFDMEQLKLCAKKFFREKDFDISDEAMKLFERNIIEEKSDGRFYGIKTVRKIVSEMLFQKLSFNTEHEVSDRQITEHQISAISTTSISSQSSGLKKLDEMVGMKDVKKKMLEIIAQIETALHNEKIQSPCIHMRFVGNPGTGKTTVARIIGQILREKGILRNGSFFEYGGRDFCGRYVGETAPKTAAMCRDAYGSVLFIDEAYSLYREDASGRDYGREAIDTLISEMENHRNDLLVIMAGYPQEMEHLMTANPGLKSRMPYVLEFPNFDREELSDIFLKMTHQAFSIDNEM